MKLYRKVLDILNTWNPSQHALLVYGPRQVGKTYILNDFLQNKFGNNYLYINLFENHSLIESLVLADSVNDLLNRISLFLGKDLNEKTCLFIDEIQEYYVYIEKHKVDVKFDLITASKFLIIKGIKVVFSGSLLQLQMQNVLSNPVGYMLPIEMYPLDFKEFIIANGVGQNIIDIVHDCLIKRTEVPDYIHTKLLRLFKEYLLVGGMPQAVSEYIETKSFVRVENVHKSIDHFIRLDITKYASQYDKLKVDEIYNLIPTELNTMSKRFIISDIPNHNKRNNEILSFSWLNKAGVTIPTYITQEPKIPLKASSVRNKLKIFHEDVGLLTYLLLPSAAKMSLIDKDIDLNYGAIYENAVAEQLRANGHIELYYYDNKKNGEVDFLIEDKLSVIPIEIKSGKNYKRHAALNNLLSISNYDLKEAYVFHNGQTKKDNLVLYLPIYMVMFI